MPHKLYKADICNVCLANSTVTSLRFPTSNSSLNSINVFDFFISSGTRAHGLGPSKEDFYFLNYKGWWLMGKCASL